MCAHDLQEPLVQLGKLLRQLINNKNVPGVAVLWRGVTRSM